MVGNAWGQRTCGADSVHVQLMGFPGYERAYLDRLDAVNAAVGDRLECDDPLLIPVAVHFQNAGIPIDCAIEMALSQVETLNQDFAATNGDLTEWMDLQPSIWPSIDHGESCISFCLATLNHPGGFGLDEGDYAVTLDQTAGDNDAPGRATSISLFEPLEVEPWGILRSEATATAMVSPVIRNISGVCRAVEMPSAAHSIWDEPSRTKSGTTFSWNTLGVLGDVVEMTLSRTRRIPTVLNLAVPVDSPL